MTGGPVLMWAGAGLIGGTSGWGAVIGIPAMGLGAYASISGYTMFGAAIYDVEFQGFPGSPARWLDAGSAIAGIVTAQSPQEVFLGLLDLLDQILNGTPEEQDAGADEISEKGVDPQEENLNKLRSLPGIG